MTCREFEEFKSIFGKHKGILHKYLYNVFVLVLEQILKQILNDSIVENNVRY